MGSENENSLENLYGSMRKYLPKIQIDFDIDNCGAGELAVKVAKCFTRIRNDFDEQLANKFKPSEANEWRTALGRVNIIKWEDVKKQCPDAPDNRYFFIVPLQRDFENENLENYLRGGYLDGGMRFSEWPSFIPFLANGMFPLFTGVKGNRYGNRCILLCLTVILELLREDFRVIRGNGIWYCECCGSTDIKRKLFGGYKCCNCERDISGDPDFDRIVFPDAEEAILKEYLEKVIGEI